MAGISSEQSAALLVACEGLAAPNLSTRVYRDECCVSFTLPQDEGGLYVNLKTFKAYASEYLALDAAATDSPLYLHQHWVKVPKEPTVHSSEDHVQADGGQAAVEADGTETYTFEENWRWRKDYRLYLPSQQALLPFPDDAVPEALATIVNKVINAEDAFRSAELSSAKVDFVVQETKYAEALLKVDNGVVISGDPAQWKCAECGLGDNLWLNLSDGHIGCGRQQEGGQEGHSHALKHFKDSGELYPLAVKLGTITQDGKGDVYSYAADEDDMVKNPFLAEHLARWGINMSSLSKTAKSMAELNLDLNHLAEQASIAEKGKKLVAAVGAGYTGLRNLGNSCYMNSLLQALITMPEFQHALLPGHTAPGDAAAQSNKDSEALAFKPLFSTAIMQQSAVGDLLTQLRKLAVGVVSHRNVPQAAIEAAKAYAATKADGAADEDALREARVAVNNAAEEAAVAPRQLRHVLAAGHPDFGSNLQQDVLEYFGHVLEQLEKAEKAAGGWKQEEVGAGVPKFLSKMFSFVGRTRMVDDQTGKVRYQDQETLSLDLPIPLEAATNKAEVQEYEAKVAADEAAKAAAETSGSEQKKPRTEPKREVVVPHVPFDACLQQWHAPTVTADFMSPDTGVKGTATRMPGLGTFPRYLAVSLRRYKVNEQWQPVKIDAEVPMPQELDLSAVRQEGLQEGEVEMAGGAAAGPAEPNPDVVAAATAMGFSENAGKRAALATGNSDVEAAVTWIMSHMDDPELNNPPAPTGGAAAGPQFSPEAIMMLTSMGFPEAAVKKALFEKKQDMEGASDWLLTHAGELDSMDLSIDTAAAEPAALEDGAGQYELVAIVSHIGKTTAAGHYVAHVKRAGRWVFCNDRSVTLSQATPFGRGFLYFYRRKDAPALQSQIGEPVAVAAQ